MATDMLRPRGPKKNHKKGIAAEYKAMKRTEAQARDAANAKLTPQQKLAKLDAGGFTATKQRARLQKQISGGT